MKLDKFYSLRKDFTIIGLTGRVGAGCSEVAKKLNSLDFISSIDYRPNMPLEEPEKIKFNICINYLKTGKNFTPFKIINYKNVLLLHLLFEASREKDPIEYIINVITQYGDGFKNYEGKYSNRFGNITDNGFLSDLRVFLEKELENINFFKDKNESKNLNDLLKNIDESFILDFFDKYKIFSDSFYELLNSYSITKRTRFTHDIAINLRETGKCINLSEVKIEGDLENIYIVAESINKLIKLWRKANSNVARIVIDSLKNSLELMYFKEKYSGFYMVAVNRGEMDRNSNIKNIIKKNGGDSSHIEEIVNLDNAEFRSNDVNKGLFGSPDIENCIQKSGYHIYHSNDSHINNENCEKNIDYQLIKLLALISQPGIITPTAVERTMQIAFNAKYNSGCISRQVGAVVTDKNFSVKAIGWNDVAQNQMPCNLRSVKDLMEGKSSNLFSEYEKQGGDFKYSNDQPKSFIALLKEDLGKLDAQSPNLQGRNCSFCFKSFQNAYEQEKNQVHTRSLHAEENAMLQISKRGGVGLLGGFLFTTASPCELCAKKAYQIGITKIFYIDPYPGISMTHILKSGVDQKNNPSLEMFRGAVGRIFHKLYEPFMAYKDELKILTGLEPIERKDNSKLLNKLVKDKSVQSDIEQIINNTELQKKINELIINYTKK